MITGYTCSAPSARQASATTSDESTPPEAPTTTESKPTLCTSSWMKPQSSSSTTAVSISSASTEDALGLGVVDIVTFISEQWVGDAGAAQRRLLEALIDDGLVGAGRFDDRCAIGTDDARAAPECDAVLVADTIAVHDICREQLCIRPRHRVVAVCRPQRGASQHPASGRRGWHQEDVDTLARQQRHR